VRKYDLAGNKLDPDGGRVYAPHRESPLKLEQIRPNVFTLRATSQELSALVAAARMALDLMRSDSGAPAETLELLTRVLRDYDRALLRHEQAGGRSSRPPVDSFEDESSSR
jgi:hypothetical protein